MKIKNTIIFGLILLPFLVFGQTTLSPLDQWKATTSPNVGITQRIFGKNLILSGLSSGLLQIDSTGLLSAGGSIPGMWATTSSDYWITTKNTDNLIEGSSNKYYSDLSVSNYLNILDKGYFFSTTSANYAINAYVNSSTTIPKNYTTNIFTGTNSFMSTLNLNGFTNNGNGTTTSLSITGLTGILKANDGTAPISVAVAGVDYPGLDSNNTFSLHNIFSSLFATNASSTNATTTNLYVSSYESIGTTTNMMDSLTVDGGINSTWASLSCDPGSMIAAITANTNDICGGFAFQIDAAGGMAATNGSGSVQTAYRIHPGSLGGNCAAGNGAILRTANLNLYLPNNPMKMEVIGRPGDVTLASTSVMRIGFANLASFSADTVVQPTSGCFFEASSTQANWWAICKTANNAVTQVNTNVASSSSITAESGVFRKFRIELTNSPLQAKFYIQTGYGTAYGTPITIDTNVANNANMSALVSVGKASAGKSNSFDIMSAKLWYRLNY